MNRAVAVASSMLFVACSSTPDRMDAAVGDLSVGDLTIVHCLASTPRTLLSEGPCSYAPPNGYCFVEFPSPAFWPGGLGVGDSLEVVYQLPGPLPAGRYVMSVRPLQQSRDALLHFDIVYRHPGEPDHPITSGDSFMSTTDDGGVGKGSFGAELDGPAAPAVCDDFLVVKVKFVSGSSPILEFFSDISIP